METLETPFLISLPKEFYEDLDARIKQAVSEAISGNSKKTRYLTRKEVCELLNISLPTLGRYCSKGILTGQKIGTRILFDESTLKKSLHDLPVKFSGR